MNYLTLINNSVKPYDDNELEIKDLLIKGDMIWFKKHL